MKTLPLPVLAERFKKEATEAAHKANRQMRLDNLASAAEQGSSDAQYDLGMHFYKGIGGVDVCLTTATQWLTKAADQNHADALLWLGEIYENSDTVEQRQQARSMYASAALYGNIEAHWRLVMFHADDENNEQVMHCLTNAAQGSHMEAQLELGEAYRYGLHKIKDDLEKAVIWYTKAAAQGSDHAKHVLSDIQAGA